jgi:hypothetical protein
MEVLFEVRIFFTLFTILVCDNISLAYLTQKTSEN